MKASTVACLAVLCFTMALASTVSGQSHDEDLDQFEVETGPLDVAKVNLPKLRNRCTVFGSCIHDKICNDNCKRFGYRDGECSGPNCICCS